jgi:hypothetical protein
MTSIQVEEPPSIDDEIAAGKILRRLHPCRFCGKPTIRREACFRCSGRTEAAAT